MNREPEHDQIIAQKLPEAPWTINFEKAASLVGADLNAGLDDGKVERQRNKFGLNVLEEKEQISFAAKLLAQFKDVMVLILIAASVLSAVMQDWVEAGVILIIVVINAVLSLVQEGRAEKALAALQQMSSPHARVVRNGDQQLVMASELVPGDLVMMEAGDLVPADIRLVESQSLMVEEASLTGESLPVEKNASIVLDHSAMLGDRSNMLFMGTAVTSGRASGFVCYTGSATEIGKISDRLQNIEDEATPLQKSLNQLGKWLGIICVAVCVLILFQGIVQGGDPKSMVMTAISLAVAAIPEGLPAVVTIVLALGMRRMADRNSIVKRLLAVETLGSVDVICTDKTGTLTQNEMTVTRIYTPGLYYEVTGTGYSYEGEIRPLSDKSGVQTDDLADDGTDADSGEGAGSSDADLKLLLKIAALCNEAAIQTDDDGQNKVIGDPTEGALLSAAAKAGLYSDQLQNDYPRIADWPFDSDRKMMTSFHQNFEFGEITALTKGAPDLVLAGCSRLLIKGRIQTLTADRRRQIMTANANMARKAMRVLAYAFYEKNQTENNLEAEKDMVFVGLTGMIDPPRTEARDAIKLCHEAGIRAVMITGDYADTASAIADDLGLKTEGQTVLNGSELQDMNDQDLREAAVNTAVYARVSPEHKVRIVDALRQNGHITSMTGDGVNDAMALKSADIGVAMGITGTEVAKSTADMILTDDNFATIVDAVREGRIIYSNIRKFVGFLLSCNVGEILIIAIIILVFGPENIPLLPIQLLWLNLITDSFPALALGQERGEPDIMKQPPRNPREPILNGPMLLIIISQSLAIFVSVLFAFLTARTKFAGQGQEQILLAARTYAFTTLILAELFRSLSARSERHTVFKLGLLGNRSLIKALLFSLVMLFAVVYIPVAQPVFSTMTLLVSDWLVIIPLSLVPFATSEIIKLIKSKIGR